MEERRLRRSLRSRLRGAQNASPAQAEAELLVGLEKRGLATSTSPGSAGPAQATPAGAALPKQVTEIVAAQTRDLYAGLDTADLVTAHNVLTRIIARAQELTAHP